MTNQSEVTDLAVDSLRQNLTWIEGMIEAERKSIAELHAREDKYVAQLAKNEDLAASLRHAIAVLTAVAP